MKRKEFLSTALLSIPAMNSLKELSKLSSSLPVKDEKQPVIFFGHGNPMNAIEENEFTKSWKNIGEKLDKPVMILCVSAHWETNGTFVTAMEKPKMIYDMYGFPKKLYEVDYPAPGSPAWAGTISETVKKTHVGLDQQWGFDHGTWSVLKHVAPDADIPVLQFSLDYTKDAKWHYELAQELAVLRSKGVLIVGSGNMVHNLRMVNFSQQDGYDWAKEADAKFRSLIDTEDFSSLVDYKNQGESVKLAVPSPDHYLPLLYILALKDKKESVSYFNDKLLMGSLSMTSIKISS